MKKIIMTAAVAMAFVGAANAQSSSAQDPVNYNLNFVDKIVLTPTAGGNINFDAINEFSEYGVGKSVTGNYNVDATRAWNMKISATDFVRNGNAAPETGIPNSVEPELILTMAAASNATVTGTAPHPQPNAPTLAATGNGGTGHQVQVTGTVTPTFALNMSGEYSSTILVVASLN
jgi:hypothetical protein